MTATIVQDKEISDNHTLLAQTGGGVNVSDNFTQTEQQIETFEASTQTEGGQEPILL